MLDRHGDGTVNFGIDLLVTSTSRPYIDRKHLKDKVQELFRDNNDEIALFYFSGHGYVDSTGGFLITSEVQHGDDGLSMNELLTIANSSAAKNRIIVIDSCHSGQMGTPNLEQQVAALKEGMTILTASSSDQYAMEKNGSGVFTTLFVDALQGSAANLVGDITPGSVYAHIDQSLGPWQQRPIFKTNVKMFTSLRKVQPPISLGDLRQIGHLFPEPSEEFALAPSYEPESDFPNPAHVAKFNVLQRYNRVNLVVPVGEEHMYHAAMNSRSCKLTALGEHYWKLVKRNLI